MNESSHIITIDLTQKHEPGTYLHWRQNLISVKEINDLNELNSTNKCDTRSVFAVIYMCVLSIVVNTILFIPDWIFASIYDSRFILIYPFKYAFNIFKDTLFIIWFTIHLILFSCCCNIQVRYNQYDIVSLA